MSRRLADLRAPQLAAQLDGRSILVQPLGAIEQHGPHLPFVTDLLIAERVAEAAVDRVGEELSVWLLPSLAYTKSNEHAWSSGTIWLSADTMLRVLDDVGRCVATTPARKLVFFNGHGGNSALLGVANREVRLAHGLQTFLAHPGVPPDQGGVSPPGELGMGIHGGTDETSLMLYLAPDLVDQDLREQSLYALLERRYGLRLVRSRRAVEAHAPSARLARDLGIPRHGPVLKLTDVSYDADNRPVETFVAYHRGDRSRFEVELERAPGGRAVPPLVRVL